MKNFKIKITLKSSVITPFHSDTIFGHICWGFYYLYGKEDFMKFLKSFENENPAIILSNAFPENFLPMPILSPMNIEAGTSVDDRIKTFRNYKRFIKEKLIKKRVFDELNKEGLSEKKLLERYKNGSSGEISVTDEFLHTSINRLSGSALEGYLYEQEESFYKDNMAFDLYCKIADPMTEGRLEKCFEYINNSGFGKDKSSGKGRVEFTISDEDIIFSSSGCNAFMNLSNYMPGKNDPISGYYKLFTKFGKLGGYFANSSYDGSGIVKPFKKPVMMMVPGSTFLLTDRIREFYGKVVDNLKMMDGYIKHYGLSYPVPVNIGE